MKNVYDYYEIIKYIENSKKFGIKLGLDTMHQLMDILHNPHNDLQIIHVAGTNGKGSTVSYIESCLIEAGYKVGSYISPSLFSYEERIKYNHNPISKEEFTSCFNTVIDACSVMTEQGLDAPTEFELFTAVAFLYFSKKNIDFAVIEVGLGGRYDATNIIDKPMLTVITPIEMDHTSVLGDAYEQIAFEKAGIIKHNVPVVVARQNKEVMDVIRGVAYKHHSKLVCGWSISCKSDIDEEDAIYDNAGKYSDLYKDDVHHSVRYKSLGFNGSMFIYDGDRYITRLIGQHQIENAMVAITAIKEINEMAQCERCPSDIGISAMTIDKKDIVSKSDIVKGIENTRWPCRLECIECDLHNAINQTVRVILDGAHNPHGAKALVQSMLGLMYDECSTCTQDEVSQNISSYVSSQAKKNLIIIIGMLADKDCDGIIKNALPLFRMAKKVIITEPISDRKLEVNILFDKIYSKIIDDSINYADDKLVCDIGVEVCPDYKEALHKAFHYIREDNSDGLYHLYTGINSQNVGNLKCKDEESFILVFGSFYLTAPIRSLIVNNI